MGKKHYFVGAVLGFSLLFAGGTSSWAQPAATGVGCIEAALSKFNTDPCDCKKDLERCLPNPPDAPSDIPPDMADKARTMIQNIQDCNNCLPSAGPANQEHFVSTSDDAVPKKSKPKITITPIMGDTGTRGAGETIGYQIDMTTRDPQGKIKEMTLKILEPTEGPHKGLKVEKKPVITEMGGGKVKLQTFVKDKQGQLRLNDEAELQIDDEDNVTRIQANLLDGVPQKPPVILFPK